MENELTSEEKRKKIFAEIKDVFAGAAFPLMLMLIFGASIFAFADSVEEIALKAVIVVAGEIFLVAAYVVFGRQNGVTAMRKTVQNRKKRELGTDDFKVRAHTGEYAVYKGVIIAAISCIPYILVQIIGGAAPNTVCDFLPKYVFGWAYFPFTIGGLTSWFGLILIIPLVGVHTAAYVWGGTVELKKQNKVTELQNSDGKNKKK